MNIFQTIINWFKPEWTNEQVTEYTPDVSGTVEYTTADHKRQLYARLYSGKCNDYQKTLLRDKIQELQRLATRERQKMDQYGSAKIVPITKPSSSVTPLAAKTSSSSSDRSTTTNTTDSSTASMITYSPSSHTGCSSSSSSSSGSDSCSGGDSGGGGGGGD